MERIYDTGYVRDAEDMPVYRYESNGVYLIFFYDGNMITGWRLSIYPNIIND